MPYPDEGGHGETVIIVLALGAGAIILWPIIKGLGSLADTTAKLTADAEGIVNKAGNALHKVISDPAFQWSAAAFLIDAPLSAPVQAYEGIKKLWSWL